MKDELKLKDTSTNIVSELRCSNNQFQERVAKLEELLEMQKRSYGELQTRQETLQAQCSGAEGERDESLKALDAAKEENQEQIQRARDEIDSLKRALEEVRADADRLRQLKQQLEDRRQVEADATPPRGILVRGNHAILFEFL